MTTSLNYTALLAEAEAEIKSTNLEEARELAQKAGLSIESDLVRLLHQHQQQQQAPRDTTTAATPSVLLTSGHSNTDHIVVLTGDYTTDRIAELRRNLLTRCRTEQPESRSEEKWDKPHKVPGERRRRIVRERDLPIAPPEPPPSGYVVFLGQMTTKIRHDRSHERHNQTKVVQEISRMWRTTLSDTEREYYNVFCEEVRKEYKKQHLEFRATGHYTPSSTFERQDGAGLWVRKDMKQKNDLELEIASYETVIFPMRPPQYDEEYRLRDLECKERRKAKLRAMAAKKNPTRARRKKKPKTDDGGKEVATAAASLPEDKS